MPCSLGLGAFLCVYLIFPTCLSVVLKKPSQPTSTIYEHPTWLKQCKSIYLDVGSNIGVQVQKLYEPERFPGAQVLPLFDLMFGVAAERRTAAAKSGLCALGFEPNPNQQERLRILEDDYQRKGYFVHFYPYAVSGSDGNATFEVNDAGQHQDWGAHIASLQAGRPRFRNVTVQKVDFYRLLQEFPKTGHVKLMKMDIEGAEWDTLARLLPQNVLCDDRIELAFVEVHNWGDNSTWKGERSFNAIADKIKQQHCVGRPTGITEIDDETYLDGVHRGSGVASCRPATALLFALGLRIASFMF
eukprot:TRINITY_DN6331_c0_g3_i1.p1 TRINITY_DN6331_c0_g3~~TRINITY_DN6331_c0_g3_i1.p1  ORF type:complete len:301 (+),score=36.62 TRINITY_DN6331_c0_g3_i1:112-1014(+)